MKKYGYIFILPFVLAGCAEEALPEKTGDADATGGIPVEFVMACRQMEAAGASGPSGAAGSAETKVQHGGFEFEEGDIIHISAKFSLTGGSTVTSYDCLELTGGEWVSRESSAEHPEPMLWPWDAEAATFHAYYLAHSSGILVARTDRSLDYLRTEADPLYATAENVRYGAAVSLDFGHLCTKLTLSGLTQGESGFWIEKDNMEDAFSLVRDTDGTLSFGFYASDPSGRPGGRNHVAGTSGGDGTAVFYLAPGDYSDMRITYEFGLQYLTLTEIEELGNMEPGKSYAVRIDSGSGNVDKADEDEWWPDPDDDTDDVKLSETEIDDFLKAIHDGEDYVTASGIPVLSVQPDRTVLLRNVDFQNNRFTPGELPNGAVFDGSYHYVKNVSGSGIFSRINGRVSNLGIARGTVSGVEITDNAGILGEESAVSSVISNIRLKDISISVIPPETGVVSNVGALVGNNSGTVLNVEAGGSITVKAESDMSYSRVNIGGIAGQSSGALRNISMMNDDDGAAIEVICNCSFPESTSGNIDYAEGERYAGGLVGLSTGPVSNCSIAADVSSAGSRGVLVYTGGLAGMIRGSEQVSSGVSLTGSAVSGEVTGGLAYAIDGTVNGEGRSYTGGLAGYVYAVDEVSDCTSLGTVNGHDYEGAGFLPYENSYYALGGAFGQVYMVRSVTGVDARSDISTALVFGDDDLYFIGLFAGRSDTDWSDGNSCHNSGDYDFIGEIGNIEY